MDVKDSNSIISYYTKNKGLSYSLKSLKLYNPDVGTSLVVSPSYIIVA